MGNSKSNPNIFNDDEPIPQNQGNQGKNINSDLYDLDKILSLDVKSLYKFYQFNDKISQTLPVMVSLSTKNLPKNISPGRAYLDLVCVIDTSGSMEGEKLKSVQKTLGYLLDLLSENDRISLVEFNSDAKKICGLTRVSAERKQILKKNINSLEAMGGTNIERGMQTAFKILKERRQKNIVTSIFLLSDGQDRGAEFRVRDQLEEIVKEQCFSINSFGFGQDHDGPQMKSICKLKDGNFYYVEKVNQVDEFFVDALGGLFSVVGQEVELEVTISENATLMGEVVVSKTYGEMWREIKKNSIYKIKMSQLMSGISKDFILEITIPPKYVEELNDVDRNIEIVTAKVTATPISEKHPEIVNKRSNLTLTLFKNSEQVAKDSEANGEVEFNHLRVKAAETMELAINKAEKQQNNQGEQLLQDMIQRLDVAQPQNKPRVEVLKRELQECKRNTKLSEYAGNGRHKMHLKANAIFYQQSQAVEDEDMYQNDCQKEMVTSLKRKKKF